MEVEASCVSLAFDCVAVIAFYVSLALGYVEVRTAGTNPTAKNYFHQSNFYLTP